jgi:hypothetical protein
LERRAIPDRRAPRGALRAAARGTEALGARAAAAADLARVAQEVGRAVADWVRAREIRALERQRHVFLRACRFATQMRCRGRERGRVRSVGRRTRVAHLEQSCRKSRGEVIELLARRRSIRVDHEHSDADVSGSVGTIAQQQDGPMQRAVVVRPSLGARERGCVTGGGLRDRRAIVRPRARPVGSDPSLGCRTWLTARCYEHRSCGAR